MTKGKHDIFFEYNIFSRLPWWMRPSSSHSSHCGLGDEVGSGGVEQAQGVRDRRASARSRRAHPRCIGGTYLVGFLVSAETRAANLREEL
mmetsp:Transcript_7646/g.22417  ORF Transcript_7646/g.22417 Transcript_7646/m.22417 type:complete len:90 (-) Transcript_7646:2026-2295(-)